MNLVIQGEEVSTPDLKALHGIARGESIERVSPEAFRITRADPATRDEVAAHCAPAKLDWGFVREGAKLADFGLLAMDMDSTLISIECIDEIADYAGRKPEVAAVTAAAMRGEIDWPESLRQRVKALAGLDEGALERVYADRLRFNPGAEKLIEAARRSGLKTLLVSGGFTYFTDRVRDKLKFDYAYSNTLVVEAGRLAGRVTDALPGVMAAAHTDVVYACGPMGMLKAVSEIATAYGAHSQCAVEEAMACGIGICMTCVLPVVGDDGTTRMVRSCVDGPVFNGERVRWDDVGTIPTGTVGAPA